jgi:acyl carrier protein
MRDPRADVLERYIRTNLLAGTTRALDEGTRLVSDGVIDSMGLVLLASFVEEEFGVRIDDADIRAGGLETITDVLALVDRAR